MLIATKEHLDIIQEESIAWNQLQSTNLCPSPMKPRNTFVEAMKVRTAGVTEEVEKQPVAREGSRC